MSRSSNRRTYGSEAGNGWTGLATDAGIWNVEGMGKEEEVSRKERQVAKREGRGNVEHRMLKEWEPRMDGGGLMRNGGFVYFVWIGGRSWVRATGVLQNNGWQNNLGFIFDELPSHKSRQHSRQRSARATMWRGGCRFHRRKQQMEWLLLRFLPSHWWRVFRCRRRRC